jgi:hypothetical protein
VSCGSKNQEAGAAEEIVVEAEIETDEDTMLEEELTEEEVLAEKIRINDSLLTDYKSIDLEYQKSLAEVNELKNEWLKLTHEYSGVYEIDTEIWYFDSSFNLMYYYRDMGVEGGYQEAGHAFYSFSKPTLYYNAVSEMGDPTVEYRTYVNNEERMRVGYNPSGGEYSYFIPNSGIGVNDYQSYLEKLKKSDFSYENGYRFSDAKEVESPYGGTESEGYYIEIDSLLFGYLYAGQ